MQAMSSGWAAAVTDSARQMESKVEIYNGSTLLFSFLPDDKLQSVDVSGAQAEPFGWCASQQATIDIIDPDGTVAIPDGAECRVYRGAVVGNAIEYAESCRFYVVHLKQNGYCITITAQDAIAYKLSKITASFVSIAAPFTLQEYASAIGAAAGLTVVFDAGLCNNLTYTSDDLPNLDGSEKLSDLLQYIAQLTGSGCYVDNNAIHFRVLGGTSILSVTREHYFDFSVGNPIVLTGVTSATEVGDNITAGTETGYNYIMHNNPFLVNRPDIGDALQAILTQNASLPIVPYTLDWRGNPALDIGDVISVTLPDDESTINVMYLNESGKYAGGYHAQASFDTPEQENPESNPATLGEALNRTRARIDKANQRIDFEASRTDGIESNVAAISMTTDQISQSVQSVQEDNGALKTRVGALETTADGVSVKVQDIIDNGVSKVVTETGYEFGADGLHISKSGEEMENQIDHTGVYVKRNDEVVLQANNNGVEAENVTVRTYLTVGLNSRFEDYGSDRTGCFYVGGGN